MLYYIYIYIYIQLLLLLPLLLLLLLLLLIATKCLLEVGVQGACKAIVQKILSPSIPTIVVTVKIKCWVGFQSATKNSSRFTLFQLLYEL